MHPEIEKLIKLAVVDGKLTEKEREIIFRKAEALGEDKDEVELILDGELAISLNEQKSSQSMLANSSRENEVKKCPACGALVGALQLKCSDCGCDFNKETESNKNIRDCIQELQNQLLSIDNEKVKFLGKETLLSIANPTAFNNKKAQFIYTFTLPNTKESLIQLLVFAYSNYEAITDNALARNPLKKAWLAKSKQAYSLLKVQKEGDRKIQEIILQYSFLDESTDNTKKKNQIEKELSEQQGSTTKKFLKWGGIGCGGIIFISILISLFGMFKMYNSNAFDQIINSVEPDNAIDSLLTLGLVVEAKTEANRINDDYLKNEGLDKIKIYEYKRLLEVNDIVNARNKANSISSEYNRNEALDDIVKLEMNQLIEVGDIQTARNKANLINSDYEREDAIDKILLIEIDKLIDNMDFDNANLKAKQINNEYTRKDALNKVNNSKE